MKKKDIILIAAVLAISLISFAAIKMTQKDGKEVIVTVEGKEVYKNIHQERSNLSDSREKWHERHADQRWKSYNEKSRL